VAITCIYHGKCADGFAAAWAVKQALGDDIEFVPGIYGADPPDVAGRDVIMVDFSYKRPVLGAMVRQARSILILDHHKTAQADLTGFPGPLASRDLGPWDSHIRQVRSGLAGRNTSTPSVLFDMDRSGAQLAWDFFHPGKPRPALIDYVADRDLWWFVLPQSREVSAWIASYPFAFADWDFLAAELDRDMGVLRAANDGRAILRSRDKELADLLEVVQRPMVIGGHRVPVANLPFSMASDAAGKLAEGQPFGTTYFDRPDTRVFSLRSRDGGIDVSEIAAAYGGGGHRNAAGFQVPLGWEGDDRSLLTGSK